MTLKTWLLHMTSVQEAIQVMEKYFFINYPRYWKKVDL